MTKPSRFDYNWRPEPDDENSYVYHNGYWHADWEYEAEMDEAAFENWEARRRVRLAERNEY